MYCPLLFLPHATSCILFGLQTFSPFPPLIGNARPAFARPCPALVTPTFARSCSVPCCPFPLPDPAPVPRSRSPLPFRTHPNTLEPPVLVRHRYTVDIVECRLDIHE